MESTASQKTSLIASNVTWTLFGQGVSFILGFLSSIILARALHPEGRGIYALITTGSLLFAEFVGLNSLSSGMTFLVGKGVATQKQAAGLMVVVSLIATIIVTILLFSLPISVLDHFAKGITHDELAIMVGFVFQQLIGNLLIGILVGTHYIRWMVIYSVANISISFLLQLVILLILQGGVQGAFIQIALSILWNLIFAAYILFSKLKIEFGFTFKSVKTLIGYSSRLYPGYIGSVLLASNDIFFVSYFAGTASVGVYIIGSGLADIIGLLEPPLMQAVTSHIVSGEREAAIYIQSRAFCLVFWLTLALSAVGAIFSLWFIPFFYGTAYVNAVPVFLCLLPGVVLLSTRSLGTFFALQFGKPEIATAISLAGGLFGIALAYVMTSQWGYIGGALAFSLAALLRASLSVGLFMRYTKQPFRNLFVFSRTELKALRQIIGQRARVMLAVVNR